MSSNDSNTRPLVGGHVGQDDPIGQGQALGAQCVQFFLGDPQGWKAPTFPHPDGAEGLRAQAEAANMRIYIHAPYVLNVASTNNRIRIPSRKILQQQLDAAELVGAAGLIVHGGHVNKGEDPEIGFDNWRKTFERLDIRIPLLIENTAGGDFAMARKLEAIGRLFEVLSDYEPGFCFDTCHAFAAGLELPDAVEKVRAVTGRIDLIHANDSQGDFGSGRDRHANFGKGLIEPGALLDAVAAGKTDVICETSFEGIAQDIALAKARIDAA